MTDNVEMQARLEVLKLEVLKLAKDITEVNSLTEQAQPGSPQRRVMPHYTVDQVLVTAQRLFEFVAAEEGAEKVEA